MSDDDATVTEDTQSDLTTVGGTGDNDIEDRLEVAATVAQLQERLNATTEVLDDTVRAKETYQQQAEHWKKQYSSLKRAMLSLLARYD